MGKIVQLAHMVFIILNSTQGAVTGKISMCSSYPANSAFFEAYMLFHNLVKNMSFFYTIHHETPPD